MWYVKIIFLYSFVRTFSPFYIRLLFTLTVARVNLLSTDADTFLSPFVAGSRRQVADLAVTEGPDVPVLWESFLEGAPTPFAGRLEEPSVRCILAAFRDLCTLVWMLHVRDQLSLGLRKKLQLVERKVGQLCVLVLASIHEFNPQISF